MLFNHKPVMLNQCTEALDIKPDGIYVDGTLGGAGHSTEIVKRLTSGRLIAIDKDRDALMASAERLLEHKDKITFINDDFKNLTKILKGLEIERVDGILLDLGVSSHQIDTPERGFSYMKDAPLDMRMDREQYLTAFNVVNEYKETQLANLIYEYGEDRFSRKIAREIVKEREKEPIRTTLQLVRIIEKAYGGAAAKSQGHPAKKTFQAIRIEVNGELDNLASTVYEMFLTLKEGGRMAVITFHSLEDRAVKNAFRELEKDCICPPKQPICTCDKKREARLITKKPITASEEELKDNSRAASAKLRVAERI